MKHIFLSYFEEFCNTICNIPIKNSRSFLSKRWCYKWSLIIFKRSIVTCDRPCKFYCIYFFHYFKCTKNITVLLCAECGQKSIRTFISVVQIQFVFSSADIGNRNLIILNSKNRLSTFLSIKSHLGS